jgi:hypothetical protein
LGKVSPWVKNNRRPLGGAPLKLEEIMKKLMTALAACLVAGFVVAQSVTSANVVGYYGIAKFDSQNAWCGQAFQKVGGGNHTLSEMFNSADLGYGDTIQLFNGSEFVAYAWTGTGWENAELQVVGVDIPDITMAPSSGFYLTAANTVNMVGEVSPVNATVNLSAGYTLVTAPFPVAFNVDDMDFSALAYGDAVQVWDAVNLVFVAYVWNGTGWEDASLNPVTGVIAALGESVFLQVTGNTSFSQNCPL